MDDANVGERGGWLEEGGRTEEAKQGGQEVLRRSDWMPACDTCGMIWMMQMRDGCVCAKQGNCQVEELGKSRVELMHGLAPAFGVCVLLALSFACLTLLVSSPPAAQPRQRATCPV